MSDETYKLQFIDGVLTRSKLNWDDVCVSPEDDARELLQLVTALEAENKELRREAQAYADAIQTNIDRANSAELKAVRLREALKVAKTLVEDTKRLTYHHESGAAGEAVRLNDRCERFLAKLAEIEGAPTREQED